MHLSILQTALPHHQNTKQSSCKPCSTQPPSLHIMQPCCSLPAALPCLTTHPKAITINPNMLSSAVLFDLICWCHMLILEYIWYCCLSPDVVLLSNISAATSAASIIYLPPLWCQIQPSVVPIAPLQPSTEWLTAVWYFYCALYIFVVMSRGSPPRPDGLGRRSGYELQNLLWQLEEEKKIFQSR